MRLDSHLLVGSSLEIERVRQGGKRKRGRHEENILETQDPSWSETMIVSHASLRVRIFDSANCSYDAMSFRLARVKRIKIGLCNHFDASFTGSTLIFIDQVILCYTPLFGGVLWTSELSLLLAPVLLVIQSQYTLCLVATYSDCILKCSCFSPHLCCFHPFYPLVI
jgi:hypothetical protein